MWETWIIVNNEPSFRGSAVPLRHLRDLKDSFNKHGNEDAIKVDFILRQNSSPG
eukprot:CAMPEP_0185913618 /NCGR_PEP_ID=MMETSP0924C-20121207/369_1 /TAXON_ID=321610 /ORGANISM="Perkinsus chesapeaki, Strain ATCC PRA-65" /LENGTH=53 /DNA_ID=CAMNT_0028635357 /DNA_START=1 /DNA_END=159 /DNA_ORIENTATION=+